MRCNSRHQAGSATQRQASSLIYTLTRFRQWVAKKTRIVPIVVLLGLGGGFWVTNEAFAPQIAQAYTDRVELTLDRQPNETYETLVDRAEKAARSAAQASFGRDTKVTDVSIVIVGQNQGAIAPILSLKVSRAQWRSRPDAQHWATYFTTAQFLLRFKDVATTTDDQPGNYNPATPSQTPAPSPGLVPQAPLAVPGAAPSGNTQSLTSPNIVSPGIPSTSTPADAPPINETTNNNPAPNSSGNIPFGNNE